MHMQAVQKYVLDMTEEEAHRLYRQLRELPNELLVDEFLKAHNELDIWFG